MTRKEILLSGTFPFQVVIVLSLLLCGCTSQYLGFVVQNNSGENIRVFALNHLSEAELPLYSDYDFVSTEAGVAIDTELEIIRSTGGEIPNQIVQLISRGNVIHFLVTSVDPGEKLPYLNRCMFGCVNSDLLSGDHRLIDYLVIYKDGSVLKDFTQEELRFIAEENVNVEGRWVLKVNPDGADLYVTTVSWDYRDGKPYLNIGEEEKSREK